MTPEALEKYRRQDAEWKARHERDVPLFKEELAALCRRYNFSLIAEASSGCPSCDSASVELSVDWGWRIAESDRWSSWVRFPDET